MGNFEKLSVLVIGVIIVMILVVAIHTWTTDPGAPEDPAAGPGVTSLGSTLYDGGTTTAGLGGAGSGGVSDADVRGASAGLGASGGVVDPWLFEDTIADGGAGGTRTENDAGDDTSTDDVLSGGTTATTEKKEVAASAPGVERTVTVNPRDTLGHISQRMYGTTRYWKRISEANDNISPDRLQVGMVLKIPYIADAAQTGGGTASTGTTTPISGETYTVRAGDTIQRIAQAAYGSMERWPELWVQNLEVIPDPKRLPVGTEIRLPR